MVGFAMPTNLSPFIRASLAQERIGGPHERGPGRVSQLPWRKSGSGDLTNEARAEYPSFPGARADRGTSRTRLGQRIPSRCQEHLWKWRDAGDFLDPGAGA